MNNYCLHCDGNDDGCEYCDGSDFDELFEPDYCEYYDGTGKNGDQLFSRACPHCGGKGIVPLGVPWEDD